MNTDAYLQRITTAQEKTAAAVEEMLAIQKRRWEEEVLKKNTVKRGRPRKAVEPEPPAGAEAEPPAPAPAPAEPVTSVPVPAPAPAPAPPPVPVPAEPVAVAPVAPAPAEPVAPPPPVAAPTITHDALRHAARPIVVRGEIPVLQGWLKKNFAVQSIGEIPEDRLAEAMVKLHDIL
jgi:2-oxoglutarate dehydrogenase E2 component (dihydrolipoamide succinyltransferase)